MKQITWCVASVLIVAACTPGGGRDERPNVVASATIDAAGGSLVHGPVTLVVPEGALSAPVTVTLALLRDAPRGAVGLAYEFGPDGLTFAVPATLLVSYESLDLPAGVDPVGLRLSVLDDGRWMGLDDHVNRRVEMRVVGSVRHFSTYGIVADPREVSGRGVRWEANGITVVSSEEMFARLYVSPTGVGLFVGGEVAGPVAIAFAGLPTDAEHQMYVDGYSVHRVVRPADGGTVSLTVDGTVPHYFWLQPRPGTTVIGGPRDQCPTVGVRVGDTCTLTSDVLGSVTIEDANQVLDCAGHRIRQPFADRGTGIGILVGAFARPLDRVTIRNCVVGGAGAYFFQGVNVAGTADTEVADSAFEHNDLGIYVQASTGTRILRNRFEGRGGYTVQLYEGAAAGEVSGNQVNLSGGIRQVAVLLDGMMAQTGLRPTTGFVVSGNRVRGGDIGIGFLGARGNDVHGNDVDGSTWGVWIGPDGWPNRFWWNNVTAGAWGVYAEMGPAEVSDGTGRGNYWGHDCPQPSFTPGADGNRGDVRDSFAYGSRSGWDRGEQPNCGEISTPRIPPPDSNDGAHGAVWDDYVSPDATVRAAWDRLRAEVLANEAAHAATVRAEWAAQGLPLPERAPLPPIAKWNRDTGVPAIISGRMTRPGTADASAVVQRFQHDYVALFNPRIRSADLPDLRRTDIRRTSVGTRITQQQFIRNAPIVQATMIFEVAQDGALVGYSGQYYPSYVEVPARCSETRARDLVRAAFEARWPPMRRGGARLDVHSELVYFGTPDLRMIPAWIGHAKDRDAVTEPDPYAEFIVRADTCEMIQFGEPVVQQEMIASARAVAPSTVPHFDFGTARPVELGWYVFPVPRCTNMDRCPLRSTRVGINSTGNYRYGAPDPGEFRHVFQTGCAPHPPPCWDYPRQAEWGTNPACEVNPAPAGCETYYSRIECVSAFWRILHNLGWVEYTLAFGAEGILAGRQINLRCNVHEAHGSIFFPGRGRLVGAEGMYSIRGDDPSWLMLAPFRTTTEGQLGRYRTIDHEYAHHITHRLLGTGRGRASGRIAFARDGGQSQALDETIPDVISEYLNGAPPGVYYSAGSYGGPDGLQQRDFYPSDGLFRSRCVPSPTPTRRTCSINADCGWREYCNIVNFVPPVSGFCTSQCMWIALGPSDVDSYNFRSEAGDRGGYGGSNGRVLHQALVDYRERFGSAAFSTAHSYRGPVMRYWELEPTGALRVRTADPGPRHDLAAPTRGLVFITPSPPGAIVSETVTITEPGAGSMYVVFNSISLPENATLSIFRGATDPSPIVVRGPVEYDERETVTGAGLLFSPVVSGPTIVVRASRPVPSVPPTDIPMFTIHAWGHRDGVMPAARLLKGVWNTHGNANWHDLYVNIMSADRQLSLSSELAHQGDFFRGAFEGRGINSELGRYCTATAAGRWECHGPGPGSCASTTPAGAAGPALRGWGVAFGALVPAALVLRAYRRRMSRRAGERRHREGTP
ncbi:MAG: right-handed parallel beta-helix repeat-containing protein [Myxococcota bacterium]|nr:right-handed parallel beta-helix repeat-containing protein [Myxococcota bacterium]